MTKPQPRVLFICKIRNHFYGPSFGLINSCKFIANALEYNGIEAKVVAVVDNNYIDREVHKFKPTHVFIEALWVVPSKFEELIPLHPHVKWYVRIHSKVPFLSHEGMAVEWLRKYFEISKTYQNLQLSANNEQIIDSFHSAYDIDMEYFPNIYEPPHYEDLDDPIVRKHKHTVDIGCFGAIRPMKNQLNQALAAISFGNEMKFKIHFHVNSDRCEQRGEGVLKNLIYTFKDTKHKLVLHPWMDHHDFIKVVKTMDLGMQVSMSETFNIVAADFVWNNISVVGSDEINWLDRRYRANPHNVESMIDKLRFAYKGKQHNTQMINKELLDKYNKKATKVWINNL